MLRESGAAPLVLIVDDAEDTRELYAEPFERAGFRVAQAVDGDHALWKVRSTPPDVVVMDLAMPVLDGWAATREIKSSPKTKHIVVIALSGQATESELERAREAGADLVLTKPCAPDALLQIVQRALGQA